MIARILGSVGLLALGVVIGTVGGFVQAARWIVDTPWGLWVIPWGVAFVWAVLLVAIRAGTWLIRTRWGSWAVLLGWLAATIALSTESPSGDLALSGGGRQMTYLIGGVILGSAAATFPLPASARGPRNG
ncbi:MAG: DUF6113 family protein [Actinomycetes bacterium]